MIWAPSMTRCCCSATSGFQFTAPNARAERTVFGGKLAIISRVSGRGSMTLAPGDKHGFDNLMQGLRDMADAETARKRQGRERRPTVTSIETGPKQTTIFVVTSADPEEVQAAVADLAKRIEAKDPAATPAAPSRS